MSWTTTASKQARSRSLGIVQLSGAAQRRFASSTSGIAAGEGLLSRVRLDGVKGQFVIGLGAGRGVERLRRPHPRRGGRLGQPGSSLPQGASVMAVFGVGAALPILLTAYASCAGFSRSRGALMTAGQVGNAVLAVAILAVSALILLGADKKAEAWLVDASPAFIRVREARRALHGDQLQ